MDSGKGRGGHQSQSYPGRRTREERRSLSESLADGTSKFFSSMVAKKNGLFSDISTKIENTFATKTDTISNSPGSDGSGSPPTTPPVPHTPPPRPPPPKRLPSMGSSRDKDNVVKRMASMPAYTRTDSTGDRYSSTSGPESRGDRISSSALSGPDFSDQKGGSSGDERFSVNGMNISFDEPIYAKREQEPVSSGISSGSSVTGKESNLETTQKPNERSRHLSGTSSQPKPAPRTVHKPDKPQAPDATTANTTTAMGRTSDTGVTSHSPEDVEGGQSGYGPTSSSSEELSDRKKRSTSERGTWKTRRQRSDDSNNSGRMDNLNKYNNSNTNSNNSDSSASPGESGEGKSTSTRQRAPKFTTSKRRSSTVDEMLFDDYVDPQVDSVIPVDAPPENLMSFDPEPAGGEAVEAVNSPDSSSDGRGGSSGARVKVSGASVDSSDVEFGGTLLRRSGSAGSDRSWSSNYSLDSQPDDVTLECMEFMKCFVDKVFHTSEDISQTEKAKFGELCQYFPGRLWFSRYINSQRVHNKRVTEPVFFRLMQYLAVCLFECHEAEDFSPAKTLMNMCFTFYHEAPSPQGVPEKVVLYMYMRDQPIWQSLRFWNAAFFDAVQCERSRRPMPTNSDGRDTVTDDRQFQENITFGQLGTFACNMRAFGLSKELCLEFLRKQSTIANLRKDQVKLLRENIERVKEP